MNIFANVLRAPRGQQADLFEDALYSPDFDWADQITCPHDGCLADQSVNVLSVEFNDDENLEAEVEIDYIEEVTAFSADCVIEERGTAFFTVILDRMTGDYSCRANEVDEIGFVE